AGLRRRGKKSGHRVHVLQGRKDLPDTDAVVTFFLPLEYQKPEDMAQALSTMIPPHQYGKIMAVPNARALVITDNSNTIRGMINMVRKVDVPPQDVTRVTVQLERADAEDVVQSLTSLLGLDSQGGGSSGNRPGGPAGGTRPAPTPAVPAT